MSGIGAQQLDSVLLALGEQLALTGETFNLVVIGGSGLIAIEVVTRATRDVDVLAFEVNGVLVSAEPLPESVVKAAALVARDLGLDENWLNAGPSSLLAQGPPPGFSERLIRREYGASLSVSFASRIDQIYFKLYAAADRREPRDFADLRALNPTTAELHNAARWARTHNMPGPFDDELAQALSDLGVEDEGRDA